MSCCVPGCNNTLKNIVGKEISFHSFPSKSELLDQWNQILNIPGLKNTNRICSDHFTPDCFRVTNDRRCLKLTAVPNANLPPQSETYSSALALLNAIDSGNVIDSSDTFTSVPPPKRVKIDKVPDNKDVDLHKENEILRKKVALLESKIALYEEKLSIYQEIGRKKRLKSKVTSQIVDCLMKEWNQDNAVHKEDVPSQKDACATHTAQKTSVSPGTNPSQTLPDLTEDQLSKCTKIIDTLPEDIKAKINDQTTVLFINQEMASRENRNYSFPKEIEDALNLMKSLCKTVSHSKSYLSCVVLQNNAEESEQNVKDAKENLDKSMAGQNMYLSNIPKEKLIESHAIESIQNGSSKCEQNIPSNVRNEKVDTDLHSNFIETTCQITKTTDSNSVQQAPDYAKIFTSGNDPCTREKSGISSLYQNIPSRDISLDQSSSPLAKFSKNNSEEIIDSNIYLNNSSCRLTSSEQEVKICQNILENMLSLVPNNFSSKDDFSNLNINKLSSWSGKKTPYNIQTCEPQVNPFIENKECPSLDKHTPCHDLQKQITLNSDKYTPIQNIQNINTNKCTPIHDILNIQKESTLSTDRDMSIWGIHDEITVGTDKDMPIQNIQEEITISTDKDMPIQNTQEKTTVSTDKDMPIQNIQEEITKSTDKDMTIHNIHEEITNSTDKDMPFYEIQKESTIDTYKNIPIHDILSIQKENTLDNPSQSMSSEKQDSPQSTGKHTLFIDTSSSNNCDVSSLMISNVVSGSNDIQLLIKNNGSLSHLSSLSKEGPQLENHTSQLSCHPNIDITHSKEQSPSSIAEHSSLSSMKPSFIAISQESSITPSAEALPHSTSSIKAATYLVPSKNIVLGITNSNNLSSGQKMSTSSYIALPISSISPLPGQKIPLVPHSLPSFINPTGQISVPPVFLVQGSPPVMLSTGSNPQPQQRITYTRKPLILKPKTKANL